MVAILSWKKRFLPFKSPTCILNHPLNEINTQHLPSASLVWSTSWETCWCSCCWESLWNWCTKDSKWGWCTWQVSWQVSVTCSFSPGYCKLGTAGSVITKALRLLTLSILKLFFPVRNDADCRTLSFLRFSVQLHLWSSQCFGGSVGGRLCPHRRLFYECSGGKFTHSLTGRAVNVLVSRYFVVYVWGNSWAHIQYF